MKKLLIVVALLTFVLGVAFAQLVQSGKIKTKVWRLNLAQNDRVVILVNPQSIDYTIGSGRILIDRTISADVKYQIKLALSGKKTQ